VNADIKSGSAEQTCLIWLFRSGDVPGARSCMRDSPHVTVAYAVKTYSCMHQNQNGTLCNCKTWPLSRRRASNDRETKCVELWARQCLSSRLPSKAASDGLRSYAFISFLLFQLPRYNTETCQRAYPRNRYFDPLCHTQNITTDLFGQINGYALTFCKAT
jgi:hypothetical protein